MSISSDEYQPPKRIRRGCLSSVLIAIGLVVVVLIGGRSCSAINHSAHGREINTIGANLLAVLDSYGPIEPAEGDRSQENGIGNELFAEGSDPGRYYTYAGEAQYPVKVRSKNQKSPQEAHDAFIAYLEAEGWNNVGYNDTFQAVVLHKDDWTISVYSNLDQDPGSVSFGIDSPPAGGLVFPKIF